MGVNSSGGGAVVDRIQRLTDDLGAAVGLPVSIDDQHLRLQFYSPQMGTLDRVRIESILFRDSPAAAKRWVRAHGLADATGPIRIPPSDELGLLPRVCVPIPHEDVHLGYLWIIDADATLTDDGVARATDCARALAPLLLRRLLLERMDRRAEREALALLVSEDEHARRRGLQLLAAPHGGGLLPAHLLVVRLVDAPDDPARRDVAELTLEVVLEGLRTAFAPDAFRFLREDARAVVFLRRSRDAATDPRRAAELVHARLVEGLGDHRVVVGIGGPAEDPGTLADAHRAALDAAELAGRGVVAGDVVDAREVEPHRLLLEVPPPTRRRYAERLLGPVLEDRNRPLLTTLRTFLEAGGDAARTAETLGVHRSSVYARLARVESLLGVDLGRGDVRLGLHQALIAHGLDPRATP